MTENIFANSHDNIVFVNKYAYLLYFLDPDNRAGHTFHILCCGPKVDLIPLVKPNCGRRLRMQKPVPGLGLREDSKRFRPMVRVRIEIEEYGEDDIEPRLLHNQARAGELHQGGVGRGA